MAAYADPQAFEAEIDRFRGSGVLGRSAPLARLFDFLAAKALKNEQVAEIDIAIDVFGKTGSDPGDASVRVYIHRLRKKLDDFYAGPGEPGEQRLVIPRGEYRLALADREALQPAEGVRQSRLPWILAGIAAAGAVVAGIGGYILRGEPPPDDPVLDQLARGPIWSEIAADPRPILVVVGDYYIFGEAENGEVRRLVREFEVDSRLELEQFLVEHPDKVGEYVDLNLNYAPIGAAIALNTVLPLARHLARDNVARTVTATEMTPDMLRGNHIIYVGYLSGLGQLENTVFSRSRFGIGLSYDEILDYDTRRLYISQAGRPEENSVHRDFGYLSSFKGPTGNRIVVLAGTRDIGLMQTAEVATTPESVQLLSDNAGGGHSIEGVYEVEGLGRQNLMGHLILSDQRPDLDTFRPEDGADDAASGTEKVEP